MEVSQSEFNRLEPDDEYWNQTTFMNYNLSTEDEDLFEKKLDDRDKQVFNIIENIYGMISLGMNFSMKIIGFDQLVKRFTKHNFSQSEYDERRITCSFVKGAASFTIYPRGMINYHVYNYPLFNLTTIALMLMNGSFPVEYIDEIQNRITSSDNSRLFKIKRSNGALQKACVTSKSSIVYKTSNSKKYWKIDVNFDDNSIMSTEEIEKSSNNLIEGGYGLFNKGIELSEFLKMNDIKTITLNITKMKLDIINDEDFEVSYQKNSDAESESESESDAYDNAPYFFDENGLPDNILSSNINYIHETAKTYFFNRLDKYIMCIKQNLLVHNVNVRII
jgi:hypothetical protein